MFAVLTVQRFAPALKPPADHAQKSCSGRFLRGAKSKQTALMGKR